MLVFFSYSRRVTVSFNYFGKVVLKIREEESKKVVVPAPKKVMAVPKTFFDPEKTYVVIGMYASVRTVRVPSRKPEAPNFYLVP